MAMDATGYELVAKAVAASRVAELELNRLLLINATQEVDAQRTEIAAQWAVINGILLDEEGLVCSCRRPENRALDRNSSSVCLCSITHQP